MIQYQRMSKMFTKCSEIRAYNTRAGNAGNYVTAKIRTGKGKQAFQQTSPKVWNELPDFIRRSQSTKSFQVKTKKSILDRDFFLFHLVYTFYFILLTF